MKSFSHFSIELCNPEVLENPLTAGHLLLEHLDHIVESAATTDLGQHGVKFGLIHELANVVEGSTEITLVNGAVLVDVHEFEALLVHVKLLLGETSLIVTPRKMCNLVTKHSNLIYNQVLFQLTCPWLLFMSTKTSQR